MNTITAQVRLGNKTLPVEFVMSHLEVPGGTLATSPRCFAARIGGGTKLHRCNSKAVVCDDRAIAESIAGEEDIVAETDDGRSVVVRRSTIVRKRNAQIVAWADDVAGTVWGSKQVYYGKL